MKKRIFFAAALSLLAVVSGPRPTRAGSTPIIVSGLNQDVVVEAGATNDAGAVTATMDTGTTKTAYTWYEAGLPGGDGGGLPASGVVLSASDPTTQYLLAPYNGLNALMLDAATTSGTLTFATPAAYSSLSFLTASGLGTSTPPVLALTIRFADGAAPLTGLSITSPDWFASAPAAVVGNGRVRVDTGAFDQVGSGNPRLFQETVLLPAGVDLHPISSITLDWSAPGAPNAHTVVFAVSGQAVPEPSSVALLGAGALALAWTLRRSRASRSRA